MCTQVLYSYETLICPYIINLVILSANLSPVNLLASRIWKGRGKLFFASTLGSYISHLLDGAYLVNKGLKNLPTVAEHSGDFLM